MHRMFVVYEAYRTKNIHSVCVRNSCSRANFTSCTTRTNRTTWQGPLSTTLLTNSKRRQWEAISPVVQLKRVAPLDRTTSVHLSSCLMRCSQVMYCPLFHSNVSYSPLVPIAQLNDSYHLILTLDDLNKWWVLDMCGEFDLTMKLVDQNCHSTLPDSSKQSEHLWNPIFLYILWKKCFETCLDELWISIWHCVLSCNLSEYNSDMLFNSVYFFLIWSVIGTQMTNFHLLLTHGKNCML